MRRRGFTLVELLVVIAIIGVLIALILPAGAWHEIAGTLKTTAGGRQERPLEIYTDHPTVGIVPCVVALLGLANSG